MTTLAEQANSKRGARQAASPLVLLEGIVLLLAVPWLLFPDISPVATAAALAALLLPMMRAHGIAMWIVATEEFHDVNEELGLHPLAIEDAVTNSVQHFLVNICRHALLLVFLCASPVSSRYALILRSSFTLVNIYFHELPISRRFDGSIRFDNRNTSAT